MKPPAVAKRSNLKGGGLQRIPRPEPAGLKVPAASSAVPSKWRWHHRKLTQLLEQLCREQREHLQDARNTNLALRRTTVENATEEFDRDMLLAEAVSEQDLIYEVEQALNRIANGTYGLCQVTGKPIPKARLRMLPWTRFSYSAEATLERSGSVHFQRIGELRSVRSPPRQRPPAARNHNIKM